MRCIWATSARVLQHSAICMSRKSLHGQSQLSALVRRGFHGQLASCPTSRTIHPYSPDGRSSTPSSPDNRISRFEPHDTLKSILEKLPLTDDLTPAQLSRAAAQAVRMSIDNHELRNGYFIVNSLRLSVLRHNPSVSKIPGFHSQIQRFDPIRFDKPIFSRLSAHALLHGLIRLGLPLDAHKLTESMVREGMRVRSVSMQGVIDLLLAKSSSVPAPSKQPLIELELDQPSILELRPKTISNLYTRHALRLFLCARHHRQRRSQNSYQNLINACLLQGEIIVGSLLFAMVVKEWQLRKTLSARFNNDGEGATDIAGRAGQIATMEQVRLNYLRSENISPSSHTMVSLLSSINSVLSRDPRDASEKTAFQTSLQALANLSVVLSNHQLPFPHVAPLIRALYNMPRCENEVWIRQRKTAHRENAHTYFHRVLKQFIVSLLRRPPNEPSLPLDLHAYNALIHYALRHRNSPTLAEQILEHMTKKRREPLEPDITTYNILLRSGTLIRSKDLTDRTLRDLHQNMGRFIVLSTAESSQETSTEKPTSLIPTRPVVQEDSSTSTVSPRLDAVKMQAAEPPRDVLLADPYTLSTYVTYLVSTGQPQAVVPLIYRIFPELSMTHRPSRQLLPAEERQRLRTLSRQTCIRRAVNQGPYLFTSVLNALRKSGKTGLAERVWKLAKDAERSSWTPELMPKSGPWCLPIHAYTIMIQCYTAEARKDRHFAQALPTAGQSSSKRYVRGWAQSILSQREIAGSNIKRRNAGRHMGLSLLYSIKIEADAISKVLSTFTDSDRKRWRNVQIPRPDARFFNAALGLATVDLRKLGHDKRTSRAHWRRKLSRAMSRYAYRGEKPRDWNPVVQYVVQEMVDAGYSIPPALRCLFVGRWPSGTTPQNRRPLDRQPFFFPPLRTDSSQLHRIRIINNRGRIFNGRRKRRYLDLSRKSQKSCNVTLEC